MAETSNFMDDTVVEYTTVFGEGFTIKYTGEAPSTGSSRKLLFNLLSSRRGEFTIQVSISNTLLPESYWNVADDIPKVLLDMIVWGICIEAENEKVSNGMKIEFTTYNSNRNIQINHDLLEKKLKDLRNAHNSWFEIVKKSFDDNGEFIHSFGRDMIDFARGNSAEIRNTIVQLVQVTAIIAGGIIALGRDIIGEEWAVTSSVVTFFIIIIIGLGHVFRILEKQAIFMNAAYKKMEKRLNNIRSLQISFVQEPSVEKYLAIEKRWELETKSIKKEGVDNEIRKDGVLLFLQIMFIVGIYLLIINFVPLTKIQLIISVALVTLITVASFIEWENIEWGKSCLVKQIKKIKKEVDKSQ